MVLSWSCHFALLCADTVPYLHVGPDVYSSSPSCLNRYPEPHCRASIVELPLARAPRASTASNQRHRQVPSGVWSSTNCLAIKVHHHHLVQARSNLLTRLPRRPPWIPWAYSWPKARVYCGTVRLDPKCTKRPRHSDSTCHNCPCWPPGHRDQRHWYRTS